MADLASSINGFAPLDRLETTTDRLTGRAGLSLFGRYLRSLGIGYVAGGRMYSDLTERIERRPDFAFRRHERDRGSGVALAVPFRPPRLLGPAPAGAVPEARLREGEQKLLAFSRPERVLSTNLGTGGPIDNRLEEAVADPPRFAPA